jgi:hypothetical protein
LRKWGADSAQIRRRIMRRKTDRSAKEKEGPENEGWQEQQER